MAGPWAPVVAAGVSAGAGIGGSLIAGRQSRKNQERTERANRALAEYAYEKDLEMWERNNAYNSPLSQMERLREAGLNPNLVYGTGTVGNTSGQSPRYNPPTVDYSGVKPALDLPAVLGQYQDFQVRQAQIDNIRAQTANVEARTASETMREFLLNMQGQRANVDLEQQKYLNPYQAGEQVFRTQKAGAEVEQAWQQLRNMRQDEMLKQLQEQYQRKALTTQDIEQEQRRAELLFSQFRNKWMQMGVTTADHVLLRVFVRMITEAGVSPESLLGK